ncbi:MAG: hypothetical protein WBG89_08735 [Ornithinimicrobium sp.]
MGEVEVWDAADPDATRRVRALARESAFWMSTMSFWYLCAELSVLIAVASYAMVDLPWWGVLALSLPGGPLLYAGVWSKLTFRIGIKPGDQWFVLNSGRNRAVALVKTREGRTFVAGHAANSLDGTRHLHQHIDDRIRRGGHFLTSP